MYTIKKYMLIILLSCGFGAHVSENIATEVARGIFFERISLHERENFLISNVEKIKEGEKILLYIFHLDPVGFIIVPADDQAIPNLAFGFEHPFETSLMPDNLSALFDYYKNELQGFVTNSSNPSDQNKALWSKYLDENYLDFRSRNVSPLLDAEFDQSGSWNNGVTGAIGFNGPVGCVAVAMCQVMHYWKHPEQGMGSNYYTEDDYGYIQVNFEDAYYNFDNMPATYANANSQLLLYHAGVSVNMDYGFSGSGAWVVGGYPSAFYAMENFFRYSSDISYVWKDNYSTTEYRNIIKNELDNNRPVISQGYDNGGYGGHAWNIDGYSGNNLHCNWGWGGSSNGYFNLTSMGGFPYDQAVIINILPDSIIPPIALYEYSVNDLTVSFEDLSFMINEYEINSWLWNFGDGSSSASISPVHVYNNGGNYEVSLIVTDIYGQESAPHIELIELSNGIVGDINFDSIINILDIVLVVNFVLGSDNPSDNEFSAADLNSDGILNILDVVSLANLILGAD